MAECVSRSHGNLWSRCQVLWVLLDASQKDAGTKERFSGTKISTQMIWGPWSRTGHSTTLVKTKHRNLWGCWGTQETRGHVYLLGRMLFDLPCFDNSGPACSHLFSSWPFYGLVNLRSHPPIAAINAKCTTFLDRNHHGCHGNHHIW